MFNGRQETELERCDRNLAELLQEVRVVQTGVQVLFGFLLALAFTARFQAASTFQRIDYFATLIATCSAAILLIAPTSYHRTLFRLGDKEHLVTVANRFALAGLMGVALSIVGAVLLVSDLVFGSVVAAAVTTATAALSATAWYVLPLARRREVMRRPAPAREIDELPEEQEDDKAERGLGRSADLSLLGQPPR